MSSPVLPRPMNNQQISQQISQSPSTEEAGSAVSSPDTGEPVSGEEGVHGIRLCEISLADETFSIISMPACDNSTALQLTPGERDIVVRILLGQSNQEIANARGSQLSTVSNQVYSIFDKLGVESRTQLAERMVPRTAGR